ncbi:hypothetical protein GW17_00009164 [Ensete ventricosum]|nr:hypothetical protein GW17_00009164 [Ensete ventricosum]
MIPSRGSRTLVLLLLLFSSVLLRASSQTNATASGTRRLRKLQMKLMHELYGLIPRMILLVLSDFAAIHVEESTRREVAAVRELRGGSRGGGGGRSPMIRGGGGAAAGGSGGHSAACSSYGRHVAITSLALAIGAAIVNSM